MRLFFVISGFLITYLLQQEYLQNGNISLRDFYIRRGLRILPVFYAYLMVVALMQFFTGLHQSFITWVGDLTFTANILPRGHISGHLWSLSVEEQFYLIWPLVLCWLNGKRRVAYFVGVLSVPIVVGILWRALAELNAFPHGVHSFFSFSSPMMNFNALDVGCIAAFVFIKYRADLTRWLGGAIKYVVAVLGFLLVFVISNLWQGLAGNALSDLLQAVGFALLLLTSILFPEAFPCLNWRVVTQLGILSYSIYIWQQIFCPEPNEYGFTAWYLTWPGWLLPAIGVACVSYYGLERPLLKLRARFRR